MNHIKIILEKASKLGWLISRSTFLSKCEHCAEGKRCSVTLQLFSTGSKSYMNICSCCDK